MNHQPFRPRVALHTLGCKVNQYETQKIAEDFRARGFDLVDFSGEADVYVINTCTVTNTADSKSRQAARQAIHRNPNAKVVITGCYAETSEEELARLDGISLIIGNQDKPRLVDKVVSRLFGGVVISNQSSVASGEPDHSALRIPHSALGRTRALVKIQDGCDQFCAYCAVPLARSTMTSRVPEDVLAEARSLAESGFREVVLTGIRLGRYEHGLVELIRAMTKIHGIERIRLSSLEITDAPDGLLELMASNEKVCRHLHLPLQSGHDEVLAAMNRPYTTADFEAFVAKARSLIPDIAITTDIMVSFPGETEEQFQGTCDFAERIRFSRAHVFPFSPRPGTAASRVKDDIPSAEKTHRRALLADLTSQMMHEFAEGLVGRTVNVLVEGKQIRPNVWSGLTDNYVRVTFQGGADHVGRIVQVAVQSAHDGSVHGEMVDG